MIVMWRNCGGTSPVSPDAESSELLQPFLDRREPLAEERGVSSLISQTIGRLSGSYRRLDDAEPGVQLSHQGESPASARSAAGECSPDGGQRTHSPDTSVRGGVRGAEGEGRGGSTCAEEEARGRGKEAAEKAAGEAAAAAVEAAERAAAERAAAEKQFALTSAKLGSGVRERLQRIAAVRDATEDAEADDREPLSPESLQLSVRGLQDSDIELLSSALEGFTGKLHSVNLSFNTIADVGACALGKMLCSSSKLTKLYLYENQIGDEGLASLAGGMLPGGASGLEELRLSFNRFGDRGAQALADCWKLGGGRHLRHVLLASNRIGDAGAIAFAEAVDETPLLQVLTFGNAMGGNLIGDDGARALANSVVHAMPHMIELNLKLNPISPQTRQEIYSLLLNRNVLLIDLP